MNPAKPSASATPRCKKLSKRHRAWIAALLTCTLYFTFAAALLHRSGEYLPLDAVIEKQQKTGGVYGTAAPLHRLYYKQRLYDLRKPDIIALGSSRVLGFRQQDFAKPFVNMGGMADLEEMTEAAENAVKTRPPKLMILGVDFWWFHPQAETPVPNRSPAERGISLGDLFRPLHWLATGRVTPSQAWAILRGTSPDIGITGITRRDGFDAAGAWHDTSIVTGSTPPEDFQFAASISRAKESRKNYAHADTVSEMQFNKLAALLDLMDKKKIHVVMFVPPVAERVYREMEKTHGYEYAAALRQRLAALANERHIPFFDYHAGGPAGTQECEFADADHGGTVVYQRMLLDMAVRDAELRGRLNLAAIGWNIEHSGGQSSLRDDEVDFLGLNCTKPSVRKRL